MSNGVDTSVVIGAFVTMVGGFLTVAKIMLAQATKDREADRKERLQLATAITSMAENSKKVADALNQVLADEFVLYVKTLNFHWNIEGRDFHALHLFLDEQYNQLQTIIDSVAERVRKIGHFAIGSMNEFLSSASLKEHAGAASVSENMIAELATDHEAVIRTMRNLINDFEDKYDDSGSSDFITGIMKQHEKMAWMLRASVPQ